MKMKDNPRQCNNAFSHRVLKNNSKEAFSWLREHLSALVTACAYVYAGVCLYNHKGLEVKLLVFAL